MFPKVRIEWAAKIAHIRFRYVSPSGKIFRPNKSLGVVSSDAAELMRLTVQNNLRRLAGGELAISPNITGDEFYRILSGGTSGTNISTVKLAEVIDDYQKSAVLGSKADSTVIGENIHLRHLERLLKGSTAFVSISYRDLLGYVKERSKAVSGATIKKELITYAQLHKFAHLNAIVDSERPPKVPLPKDEDRPDFQTLNDAEKNGLWDCVFLDESELDELINVLPAQPSFVRPMIAFVALTGCRRGEMLRSLMEDVDFERAIITIRESKRKKKFRQSFRQVDLHPKLAKILTEWFAQSSGPQTIRKLTKAQSSKYFRESVAGTKFEHLKGFHTLRHSFISCCVRRGVSEQVIRGWCGHQTQEMMNRYTHLFRDHTKSEIMKLNF